MEMSCLEVEVKATGYDWVLKGFQRPLLGNK